MRIVHCGNYDYLKYGRNFYAPDYRIHNGLVRNGWCVYPYSYRDEARKNIFGSKRFGIKRANERLKQVVENVKPDVLLIGHSELITTQTLTAIKEKYRIPIAMWWVDSFDEEKIGHIKQKLTIIDALFATTDAEYVKKRLDAKNANIFYLPNMCDPSMDTLKNFEIKDLRKDLLYIGRIYEEKRDFFDTLSTKKIPWVHYNNIYGAKFYEVLGEYHFGLNFSKYNDIPKYSSDRIIYLTANGLTAFSPKIPEFTTLFDEDEVIYFSGVEELGELYRKAQKDSMWARNIARNGWQKAHDVYDAQKIMRWLIETTLEVNKR